MHETRGQVLLWEGELFPAFYHTDSGGHTEDPRVVFAATNMPALQPVRVEFPSGLAASPLALDLPLADSRPRSAGGCGSAGWWRWTCSSGACPSA